MGPCGPAPSSIFPRRSSLIHRSESSLPLFRSVVGGRAALLLLGVCPTRHAPGASEFQASLVATSALALLARAATLASLSARGLSTLCLRGPSRLTTAGRKSTLPVKSRRPEVAFASHNFWAGDGGTPGQGDRNPPIWPSMCPATPANVYLEPVEQDGV